MEEPFVPAPARCSQGIADVQAIALSDGTGRDFSKGVALQGPALGAADFGDAAQAAALHKTKAARPGLPGRWRALFGPMGRRIERERE